MSISRNALLSLLDRPIEKPGDPFAIAGFCTNTRHDMRYFHIKGSGDTFGRSSPSSTASSGSRSCS